jgi:hypothetical protein
MHIQFTGYFFNIRTQVGEEKFSLQFRFSKHNFKGCKKASEFVRDIVPPSLPQYANTHKRMSDLSELHLLVLTFVFFTFWS